LPLWQCAGARGADLADWHGTGEAQPRNAPGDQPTTLSRRRAARTARLVACAGAATRGSGTRDRSARPGGVDGRTVVKTESPRPPRKTGPQVEREEPLKSAHSPRLSPRPCASVDIGDTPFSRDPTGSAASCD